MVLKKEITIQIKDHLQKNPQGLSISDIVKVIKINRNTAGRYLENLLVSGQVEMRRLGMAKIYMLSQRLPLSAVLSISSEMVIQLDSNLRIIFANEPFLKLVGSDKKDLLGKNIEYTPVALVFDEVFTGFIENVRYGIEGREWTGEIALTTKDIILLCRIAPTVFDDGRKGVTVIFDDITKRKRDEQKIEESERQFRLMAENSVDMISRIKPDGTRLYVSPAYTTTLGYELEELINTGKDEFIHPDDAQIMETLTGTLTPQNPITSAVFRTKHKDGHYIWVESIVRAIFDEKTGELSEFYAVTRDITKRKMAEDALRESEDRYRSLIETTGTGYVILDKDGRVISANQEYIRLTGRSTLNEIINKPVTDWTAPYDVERNAREVEQCVKNGQVRGLEIDYQKPDGTIQPVEINASVIQSDSDLIILGLCRDITERKRAEEDLKVSEQRYHQLVDISPDAVIIHQEGKIIFINPSGLTLLGTSDPDKIIGKNVLDFIQPEFRESVRKNIEKDLRGDITAPMELYMLRVDGTTIIVEGRGVSTSINGKPAIQVAIRDITERKRHEEALKSKERELVSIFRNVAGQLFYLSIEEDNHFRFLTVNQSFLNALNLSEDQVVGKYLHEVLSDPLLSIAREHNIQAISEKKTIRFEEVMDSPTGKRYGDIYITPIFDESGRPTNIVGTIHDNTKHRRVEEALRESEGKLSALLESITDIMSMMDKDLTIIWANAPARQYFGKDIIGRKCYEIYHLRKEPCEPYPCPVLRAFRDGKIHHHEVTLIDNHGGKRVFEGTANVALRDNSGSPVAVLEVAREITEKKKAEELSRYSEERLRLILDSTDDVIIMQDLEGRYLYFNSAELYGVQGDKILGSTPYDFIEKETADRIVERLKNVAKTGQSIREDTQLVWNGQTFWFSDSLSPVRDRNGTITAVVTISQNITNRKYAEMALRESEAISRALINAPTDSVILADSKGIILALNEIAALRFGKRSEELVGILLDDLLPEELARSRRSLIFRVLTTKEMVRFEDERDGRWFDTVAYPIVSDTGEVTKVAIIARDITNRKKMEDALILNEQRFRDLITSIGDIIWETDAQTRFVYVSPQVETLLGFKPDELIGHTPFEFLPQDAIVPNQKAFQTAVESCEKSVIHLSHWLHKDGKDILLDSYVIPLYDCNGSISGFLGIDRKR